MITVGSKVKLIDMPDDPDPIDPGAEGVVTSIGSNIIGVNWDDGRTLSLIKDVDEFEIISETNDGQSTTTE